MNKLKYKGKDITEYYEDEKGEDYRFTNGSWEVRMGESWESCFDDTKLNRLRQNIKEK